MKSLATLVPLLRVLPVLLVQPVSFALPLLSAQPVLPVPCVQPVLRVLPLLAVPSAPVAGQVAAPVACVAPGCVEQRAVSPSGRRYVVVREAAGGGVTFELRERRAGVEPMAPARRDLFAAEDHIASDPADRLLARGGYGQRPREVIVPDDLPGCVMFENMGAFGRGTVAAWIDADGTQRFALDLRAIFGDTPFVTPPGCTPWHEGYALDEARGVLLLLGQRGEVREIAIPSGVVATPSTRRLAELARAGSEAVRTLAFDALAQRPPVAARELLPTAAAVFHDRSEPIALRLRAAVALHRAGIAVDGTAELFAAGRAADQPAAPRLYAVRHLTALLGARAAAPLLRAAVGDACAATRHEATLALATIAEPDRDDAGARECVRDEPPRGDARAARLRR